jgi:hypothetical protein
MYESVLSILKKHETIWGNVPKFADAVDAIQGELQIIRSKSNSQDSITLGVAKAKSAAFTTLADSLIVLSNTIWIYANASNNFEMAARNKISASKMLRLSTVASMQRIEMLLADLTDHAAELETYGITPEFISKLETQVAIYQDISGAPRMAIVERKTLTKEIANHTLKIDQLLLSVLDKMIVIFKVSQPAFVNRYKNARMVVDNRGPSHSKVEIKKPKDEEPE